MNRSFATTTTALLLAFLGGEASAEVLNAGDFLRVTFTIDNNFNTPPDTLLFNLGLTNVIAPFTTRSAEIFDGSTSLGVHSDSLFGNHVGPLNLDPSNTFKSASSVYTFLNPTVIAFGSILDGTIVGRIDYSILTGSMDIDLAQVDMTLLRATGPNTGSIVTPAPTITSVSMVGQGIGTNFCAGDGSGTSCPCGNTGGAGEGCANSSGSGGVISANGSSSVGADDLQIEAMNLLPSQPALLFAGENAINGGNGIVFGDGLRCAGSNVVRLGVAIPDGSGAADWGPGLGATGGWSNGDTRYFQGWYRDPSGSPCGALFNLTHGLEIVFQP